MPAVKPVSGCIVGSGFKKQPLNAVFGQMYFESVQEPTADATPAMGSGYSNSQNFGLARGRKCQNESHRRTFVPGEGAKRVCHLGPQQADKRLLRPCLVKAGRMN